MKLTRVKTILTRRLAFLEARLGAEPPITSRGIPRESYSRNLDERDALRTILRCQGMLDQDDEGELAAKVSFVREQVLPTMDRTARRAERGRTLYEHTDELVNQIRGTVGT